MSSKPDMSSDASKKPEKGPPLSSLPPGLSAAGTSLMTDPATALLEQLLHFQGSPEEFVSLVAAMPCLSGDAQSAAVFAFARASGSQKILTMVPAGAEKEQPEWLQRASQCVLAGGPFHQIKMAPRPPGSARPPANARPGAEAVAIEPGRVAIAPLRVSERMEEYACFALADTSPAMLPHVLRRLALVGMIWRHFHAARGPDDDMDNGALAPALSVLSAVNAPTRYLQAAMTFVNELASKFACDRVALGFLRGRYVKISALSHAEKFTRKMELAQAVETAMEECLDQDEEIIYPPPKGAAVVYRAAEDLARRFGSSQIISIPIRYENEPVAVVTLERSDGPPPDPRDIRLLRLMADLVAPRLVELERRDRWFGARAAARLRKTAAWAVGPKHTWAKVAAVAALAAVVFLCVAQGTYRVDGTFVVQPVEQRVLAAAFDGFIEEVHARPGDEVAAGTVLATLETAELRAKLAARRAEQEGFKKEAALAQRDDKTAEAHIAQAKADQAEADCAWMEERLSRAAVRAPEDGVVLAGDWIHRVGAPVKTGDTVFELAPLAHLEAEIFIPEEMIADVAEGMEGELATAGRPSEKVRFTVVTVMPLAEVVKQRNVFRARVRLEQPPEWMKPGMEGVANVEAGTRHYAWIWTRRAVNWVRMKLWI